MLSLTLRETMKKLPVFIFLMVLILLAFLAAQLVIKNADFTKRQISVHTLTKNKVVQEKKLADNISLIGQMTYGQTFAINSMDSLLFFGEDLWLIIANYRNPTDPKIISKIHLSFYVGRIYRINQTLYVLDHSYHAFAIIDISDPYHPKKIEHRKYPSYDLAVYGRYAYLACGDEGMRVLDISDPQNIKSLVFYRTKGTFFVHREGKYLYRNNEYTLEVLKLDDPGNPVTIGSISTGSNWVKDVVFENNLLYCAMERDGLWIIDVSVPSSPNVISKLKLSDAYLAYAHRIAKRGNRVYLSNYVSGVAVVDVSDPYNPINLGGIDWLDFVTEVHINGDILYFADGGEGLFAVDISQPDTLNFLHNYKTFAVINDVAITDSIAYLLDWQYGFRVVDITNPQFPVEVNHVSTPGPQFSMYLMDQYLFIAAKESGLCLYDVSNPYDIKELWVAPKYISYAIEIVGTYLYLGTKGMGLRIIDISDLMAPREIGHFSLNDLINTFHHIIVKEPYAYLITWGQPLTIIDISDKRRPKLLSRYDTGYYLNDVGIKGHYAYCMHDVWGPNVVLDISDPANPVEYWRESKWRFADRIRIVDNFAYVDRGNYGLGIYEIKPDATLEYIAEYETESMSHDFRIKGDTIYLADNYDGMYILKHNRLTGILSDPKSKPEHYRLFQNFPNPFNASTKITYQLAENSKIKLEVFNMRGQLITVLVDAQKQAGMHQAYWNASQVASGVYFFRLTVKNSTGVYIQTKKCVLIK